MDSPQQQQLRAQMEKNDDDDYLQVLDAGEHMYGMFVANDEDLYAYLASDEPSPSSSWMIHSTEDIEDVISRSIVPYLDMQQNQGAECACCASFADMHLCGKGQGGGDMMGHNEENTNRDSANTGRLTPTQNEDHDHDAMNQ